MAYNVVHIDSVINLGPAYFFDANLWLKILKPPINLSRRDEKYLSFVERFKKDPNQPKIIITAFLLSEVINRYLHDVSYKRFCQKQKQDSPPKSYYKQVYRVSKDYKNDYINICDDIDSFSSIFILVSDDLGGKIGLAQILQSPMLSLDFNDQYYYLQAKTNGYPIVTDDGDFYVEDVQILTYNQTLIERVKSAIEIKRP
ncbi:hypothetical protein [Sediminibacterium salmoneum]|uniref:hypothetical protein n=1 Tax=Sediminibacterium salmoneum TaxID=426421 RepID=UPI00047DFF91|nr:hypothetical protein [Sediminibacterium salmoneum]